MLQIIDISKPTEEIKDNLFKACTEQGFLFVKGHGISQEHIDSMFGLSKDFFQVDQSIKDQYSIENNVGYTSFKQEQLDSRKTKDYKEAYNIGPINLQNGKIDSFSSHPSTFVENKHLIDITTESFTAVSKKLFEHILKTFELEQQEIDQLLPSLSGNNSTMLRMLRYPQLRDVKEDKDDEVRAGAHTDYGLLTLLFQKEGQQGLQLNIDDKWLNIDYLPSDSDSEGAPLVVNFGDLLQFWTNGVVKSTVHRVLVPESRQRDRYSIVCFVHPENDTSLNGWNSPRIPSDAEDKPKVSAREHLLMRLQQTYL
ncbi:unnamed protein product [Hanseniaspora opuntiae]